MIAEKYLSLEDFLLENNLNKPTKNTLKEIKEKTGGKLYICKQGEDTIKVQVNIRRKTNELTKIEKIFFVNTLTGKIENENSVNQSIIQC